MSCCVGCRHGSDPALLWLWCSLVATALIRLLAWEAPYAAGAALEKTKKRDKYCILKSLKTEAVKAELEIEVFLKKQ